MQIGESKFKDYERRKNKLIPKQLAYEIINEMKKSNIDLYKEETLDNKKKEEQLFIDAYDKVVKRLIEND